MAAFNRPTEATYEVHEHVTCDTSGECHKVAMRESGFFAGY
jgi:hypothetical protein